MVDVVEVPVPAPPIPDVPPAPKKKRVSASPKGSLEYKARKAFQQKNYYRKQHGLPPLPQPSSWSVPPGTQETAAPTEEVAAPGSLEDG